MDFEALCRRVDELLAIKSGPSMTAQAELYNGAIGVMQALYGPASSQERDLRGLVDAIAGRSHIRVSGLLRRLKPSGEHSSQ